MFGKKRIIQGGEFRETVENKPHKNVCYCDKPSDFESHFGTWRNSTQYIAICHFCGKNGGFYGSGLHKLFRQDFYSCGCDAEVEETAYEAELAARKHWEQVYGTFVVDSPCPKCGNTHRTANFTYGQGEYMFEHIARSCGVCSWQDKQIPLDYKAENFMRWVPPKVINES